MNVLANMKLYFRVRLNLPTRGDMVLVSSECSNVFLNKNKHLRGREDGNLRDE